MITAVFLNLPRPAFDHRPASSEDDFAKFMKSPVSSPGWATMVSPWDTNGCNDGWLVVNDG